MGLGGRTVLRLWLRSRLGLRRWPVLGLGLGSRLGLWGRAVLRLLRARLRSWLGLRTILLRLGLGGRARCRSWLRLWLGLWRGS